MSRKILISYGYGAGFVSWHGGSVEEKKFMLEYKPFIDWLEAGNKFKDSRFINNAYEFYSSGLHFTLTPEQYNELDEQSRLVVQFMRDWSLKFPEATDFPYLGGLKGLTVESVDEDELVLISDYDGSERFERKGSNDGWI